MTTLLRRLVFIGLLTLTVPAVWAEDTPATTPSAAQASAPAADSTAPAAADAATAPAAPTEPQLIGTDKINSGDTAWMLTSTALVLMMTIPGLALFYGGMVRKKKRAGDADAKLRSHVCGDHFMVVNRLFVGIYAGQRISRWRNARRFLNGMTIMKDANKITVSHLALTIPETVYAMFQLTFAIITPALIAGAFADRMKFSAMLIFMSVWSLVVYCPIAHWVWEPSGWLAVKGRS